MGIGDTLKNIHYGTFSAVFFLCLIFSTTINAQSTVATLKERVRNTSSDSVKIELYDQLSRAYINQTSDTSKLYLDSLWILSNKLKTNRTQALAYNRQGTYDISVANHTAAIISLEKARFFATRLKDSTQLAGVYNNIAGNDYYMQNYRRSLKSYKKGLSMLSASKDPELYTLFVTNISEAYRASKVLDSAIIYARRGIELSKKNKYNQLLGLSYFHMGAANLDREQFPEALDYLNKALRFKSLPLQYVRLGKIRKAQAMIFLERLGEAKALLQEIAGEIEVSKDWVVKLNYFKAQKEYFKKIKNFEKALEFSEEIEQLTTQVEADNRTRLSKNLYATYDQRNQNVENNFLKHNAELNNLKIKNQRNIIWAVGVFIFVLMILLLVMNRLYEVNQKATEKLKSRQKILDENNRDLEKKNSQKNNLFSIVAHDVKSPLSAIMTSINMLNQNIEDFSEEELKTLTGELSIQTESLFGLMEGVLTWAKSQMEGYKFSKKNVKIMDLINDLVSTETLVIRKKQLNINNNIPENYQVFGDPQAMIVIMRNLVSNAIKFTPHGGNIYFSVVQKNGESSIEVQDTGLGISKDKIEQIFIKRQRYTRKGTGNEKGNGIGLILCSEIANAMGGSIEVKSTVGRGSIFALVLPDEKS